MDFEIFLTLNLSLNLDIQCRTYGVSPIRRGTYRVWHIWGVAYVECGTYGGKGPLMHESSFILTGNNREGTPVNRAPMRISEPMQLHAFFLHLNHFTSGTLPLQSDDRELTIYQIPVSLSFCISIHILNRFFKAGTFKSLFKRFPGAI